MRLHLTISRHGLPITRILWTTSPPSLLGHNLPNASSILPAASSAVTSSRMPNALYSNGGYTIAQLLEDVNEVIPLETEPRLFEDESSGQWGLEDYVVEVGGSECLHFMELEGILRDGDEVLIRALQMSDLKARRISGRHQISADGKHLIDGVPFGKPFLKRPTSSRPAIMIPPRKKRRMALALWGTNSAYEEEDTEWASPAHIGTGKELSLLKPESVSAQAEDGFEDAYQDDYEDYHEPNEDGDGTVIRHHIDKTDDGSESDEGPSEADAGELSQELQDLKKDMDVSALSVPKAARASRGYSLRSRPSNLEPVPRKSSLSRRSTGPSEGESSRRKSVTFGKQNQAPPAAEPETNAPRAVSTSEEAENSVSSDSDSDSSDSDSSASESDDEDSSADESDSDTKVASESSSDSDSDSDSSSQSSESESESEFEEEEVPKVTTRKKPIQEYNPPGAGSERTRKSNQRTKMRRRLTKLKQLGLLDENADFDALREYDAGTGDSYMPESRAVPESRASIKKKEQEDFEAKRQQLLRSLESGGVDVTLLSEKENISPSSVKPELSQLHDDFDETQYETANEKIEATPELPKRRSLNVASTRRLLFGSLGVRTPHSKEEEDTTRKKLAGKIRESTAPKAEEIPAEQPESEPEVDWREKLILGATECVFDDIELSTPPFPFEQRWDAEAGEIIRRRSQRSKKRKRRQQLQVYDEEEAYDYEDYNADDVQLNYDDVNQTEMTIDDKDESDETTKTAVDTDSDLPDLPEDASGLPELTVSGLKSGLVFAFKQLDVSKATNWQPMISEYRVAVVSEVFDDNILNIQLTKPYRKEPKNADEDEGPFQYSGFEMPGMDDDDELDDGFREVLFDDLIEPKLLRVAPAEAAEAGDEGNASNSPAGDEQPAQEPDRAIDTTASNDREVEQLAEISSEPPASTNDKGTHEPNHDSIQSPRFEGFDQSNSAPSPIASVPPAAMGDSHEQQDPSLKADENELPSTCPPNVDSHDLQNTGLTDNLQTISSPGSVGSFHKSMNFLLSQNPLSPEAKSERKSSPDEPISISGSPTVPNPFYHIDKEYEERRRRNSKRSQRDRSYDRSSRESSPTSAKEGSSSPLSLPQKRKSPSPEQKEPQETSQEQETSQVSVIPDSIWPEAREPSPPASQMQYVDLTQSSPPVSPGGSDEDFAKSHRLPRGSGWVQKNNPTRRQTRQSSSQAGIRVEVSISPPRTKRGRRSRI